jgi:tetratricopeptide (TPR) repeat protein
LIAITLNSCKKVYDYKPEGALEASQMYRNVDDADAAVIGAYSKFLGVAKQYVVLNELRADLMDVTNNASDYLKEINNHSVSSGNPYADPKPFYEVILNCNDVLKNFQIMRSELKFTQDEFSQRYADISALRSWLYLQLAIQYGEVPYVTQPFEKVSDLKDQSKYPMVGLDAMIDSLIHCMEALPYKDEYPSTASIMNISAGTYNTTPFFINKRILLGDLYLWKGRYLEAAQSYKTVLDIGGFTDYDKYKVKFAEVITHADFAIGYWQRYNWMDINGLINSKDYGWRSMFCRTQDNLYYTEWIWQLFFDAKTQPNSPFIELFANYGEGKYMLKPSQQIIDNWSSQTQGGGGGSYDARGPLSYSTSSGEPVIMKYLYEYDPIYPYKKPGRMFLYRAAGLHLHYAEAANRDNKCKVALALLNRGIRREFSVYWDDSQGYDTIADITELQRTEGAYFGYTFPYNFDARQDVATFNYNSVRKSPKTGKDSTYKIGITQYPVGVRGIWCRNVGVRGRANLQPVLTNIYDYHTLTLDPTDALKDSVENYLINESALELAFEGQRWADLLRIAKRRNDPAFLADKVYAKMQKAGNPNAEAVRAKLMGGNWFLPFKW